MPQRPLLFPVLHLALAFTAGAADGAAILYSSRIYKSDGRSYQQLTAIRFPGLKRSFVSSTPRHHKEPAYSPDSHRIAFLSGGDTDTQGTELWVRQIPTGRETLLYRAPDLQTIDLIGWSQDASSLYLVLLGKDEHISRFDVAKRRLFPIAPGCRATLAANRLELAYETCPEDYRQPANAKVLELRPGKSRSLGKGSAASWSRDGRRISLADNGARQLRILDARSATGIATVPFPDDPAHWNYVISTLWSPDGRSILAGSEAGSSTAHYEDYWLLTIADRKWRYLGGGNGAQWSAASDRIVMSTPRDLAPLGKHQVWVSHLLLVDVRTDKKQPLTSGLSYDCSPAWALNGAERPRRRTSPN